MENAKSVVVRGGNVKVKSDVGVGVDRRVVGLGRKVLEASNWPAAEQMGGRGPSADDYRMWLPVL
jgi:hypothetical protein